MLQISLQIKSASEGEDQESGNVASRQQTCDESAGMRLLVGRAVLPLVCWASDTSNWLSVEQIVARGDCRRE